MERREFLRKTAAAAATAFVATGWPARSAASQTASGTRTFELEEVTIAELQAGMASGRWTAQTITQTYLERIAQLDRRGPELRAVIETNPDALAIAEQLDRERAAGRVRGPLHGIPILLKDNLDTHDRMTTTAGSLALEGSIPPQDSTVARKLREAGAILLGKANLSEWANFRSEQSTSGWSARGGQCRNPYALDRNPCGSSSGSGVGPAANLCAAAIGTEGMVGGQVLDLLAERGEFGFEPGKHLGKPIEDLPEPRAQAFPIIRDDGTAGNKAESDPIRVDDPPAGAAQPWIDADDANRFAVHGGRLARSPRRRRLASATDLAHSETACANAGYAMWPLSHPYLVVGGVLLLVVGVWLWRWSSRHDLKGMVVDAAWQVAKARGDFSVETDLGERLRDLKQDGSNVSRAKKVAGLGARHLVSQVAGIAAIVAMLSGVALLAGAFLRT